MRPTLLPALLGPLAASALDPRDLAAPTLASYELNGRGCPSSTGATTVSGSAASLSVSLPDFVAELRGSDRRDSNANCLVTLRIDEGVPGYRLALRKVWGEGMFYGTADTRLRVQSVAYFQDYQNLQAVNEGAFNASSDASTLQPAAFDFDFDGSRQVFSSCVGEDGQVGNAFVNLRAIINRPEGNTTSYGAFLGTEERPVEEHIEFGWVACGDIDEPTAEELEEGGDGVVIGGEEGETVALGGEESEAVALEGEESEAVALAGDEDEAVVLDGDEDEAVVIGNEDGDAIFIGGDD